MYGGFFRASPLRTNPMSLPHSHIHAHTDALVDHDGMRSGGAKRRCASAAELRRHHLHIPRAYQSGQDHVADPPGGLAPVHTRQSGRDGRHSIPDGRDVREDPQ